jgi:2-oxoisovalerate dehydrogenase E1 component alpha subunit
MAIEDVADRAEGYGFPGVVVDGNDVLACYAAMKQAHERARAGKGPTLIECKTYRFLGHTSDDDDKTYRPRDEVEQARHHDPVHVFAGYLRTNGIVDDVGAEAMRNEIKTEIDRALAEAWEAADPLPETALRHVFFDEGEGS